MVISASLEARNALSGYDRSDYFWSGIRPASLRDALEVELRNQGFWIDLTLPPPMHRVVEVANKFLNRDVYQPHDVNLRGRLAKSRKRNRRSEEHTSELQSPDHLVCRLLLEKKKKKYKTHENVSDY